MKTIKLKTLQINSKILKVEETFVIFVGYNNRKKIVLYLIYCREYYFVEELPLIKFDSLVNTSLVI